MVKSFKGVLFEEWKRYGDAYWSRVLRSSGIQAVRKSRRLVA